MKLWKENENGLMALTVAHDAIDFSWWQICHKENFLANCVLDVHHVLALRDNCPLLTTYVHLHQPYVTQCFGSR
jgi:hypothetical protein